MPNDAPTQSGYADAAKLYWQAGWRGILPLRRGYKKTPPRNFTGKTGGYPSYPDIMQWAELYPDGNLCLRMPPDVVGIDVDAYGAKTGGQAIAEAEKRWGPLPPTVRSTSREDGVSGIRLYRIPSGTQLAERIEFPDLGVGDIEICQRRHRYVIAWPSIHPEGRGYWWRNHHNQFVGVPNVDELPELPAAWIAHLAHNDTSTPDLHGKSFPVRTALTGGEPSAKVVDRLRQAIRELNLSGHSRHDTTRGHVMALLRLGKTGEAGVERALVALGEMFIALVTPDRPGGKDEATHEYKSMVTGDGAARQLAQPSITDWVRAIVVDEPARITEPEPVPADDPVQTLEEIEQDFWESRDHLQLIYQAALSRMASPWAVFACSAARLLSLVPPAITLPDIIGGPGSLNWFAAIAAKSGGGKGAAMAVAAKLVNSEDIIVRGIGSGEGMIEAYQRSTKTQDPPPPIVSILFSIDEIDSLGAMGGRTGQTTMAIVRQGFSGEKLGYSYRGRQSETVASHTYRMTIVASVQPERAGVLFEDAGGGTPQRFMWFPGRDKRITEHPPEWPTDWYGERRISLISNTDIARSLGTVTVPDVVRDTIRKARAASMSGDDNALDSHALFCREKLSYALAFMDGRTEINEHDWRLSGVAADVSNWCRSKAQDGYEAGKHKKSRELGSQRAIENDERELVEKSTYAMHIHRISCWVTKTLDAAGPLTIGALSKKASSRDRPRLWAALASVIEQGLVEETDGKWSVIV